MSLTPNPLHPAIVHFPIVLLLLGAVVALVTVFVRKHGLAALAAGLLVLGALGAWGAVQSGKSDGELIENTAPQVNALLDAHETWAQRTLTLSICAALAAAGAVLSARWLRMSRTLAVVTALLSIAAAYGTYQTGHRGGALVYQHGAGVNAAQTSAAQPAASTKETGNDAN